MSAKFTPRTIYSAQVVQTGRANPFDLWWPYAEVISVTEPENLKPEHDPAVLILWGGADIHPKLYGRENHGSNVGKTPSFRDLQEARLFQAAVARGIAIIGVCRGAQLACALSGGILVQHIQGHSTTHLIETHDGFKMSSSSLHHQLMYPWKIEHRLLAWASPSQITQLGGLTEEELQEWPGTEKEALLEPEVVWFPKTRALAIQGHPEHMADYAPFNRYLEHCVKELFCDSVS